MKAIVILFMIGLCTVSLTNAQDQIVLANGETLTGSVRNIRSSSVKFVPASSVKAENIKADRINNIYSSGGTNHYFYSRKLIATNTNSAATVSQLLILYSVGKIKVYRSIPTHILLKNPIVTSYIEKDDSGLVAVGYFQGVIAFNLAKEISEITAEISNLFADNPELRKSYDADKKKAKMKVILDYVKRYNEWYQEDLH